MRRFQRVLEGKRCVWHILDSQGQMLALSSKVLTSLELFILGSEAAEGECEDRVLDGPASGGKDSKGRNKLGCIRGKRTEEVDEAVQEGYGEEAVRLAQITQSRPDTTVKKQI